MEFRKKGYMRLAALLLTFCLLTTGAGVNAWAAEGDEGSGAAATDAGTGTSGLNSNLDALLHQEDSGEDENAAEGTDLEYLDVEATYESIESYGLTEADTITLQADAAAKTDGTAPTFTQTDPAYEGGMAVLSDEATGSLSWQVTVPKTGLYDIHIDYLPTVEDKSDIQRKIAFDGALPFDESGNIGFLRAWTEEADPVLDANGDEIKPKLAQVAEWDTNKVTDVDGMIETPFRYLLTAGTHTLTLEYVNADMYVGDIRLVPSEEYKTYAEVKAEYEANGYTEYTGEPVRREGEESEYRSSQILRREANSDPGTTPYVRGHVKLYTIGGYNWRAGNQLVEWVIDVPADGLYKLNMRIFQNHGEGLNVHRQITIDGEVPFAEVAAYAFGYSSKWQNETICDAEGNPYLFYLTAGQHVLGVQVKMGDSADVINGLLDINNDMSQLIRNITRVTGSEPDANFDYQLEAKVPSLMEQMTDLRDRYRYYVDFLTTHSRKVPTLANSLNTAADQLDYLIERPKKIPAKLDELTTTQTSVSTWYYNIQDQPMMIDYVQFVAPAEEVKMPKSSIWEKIVGTCVNFALSFVKDYDSVMYVSTTGEELFEGEALDVWVARSKEMCEIIQQMASEEFTPESHIGIAVNVLPSGSVGAVGSVSPLMLAVISGNVPDIALGSDSQTPVELAIRGAAYDLKNFEGYDEVASWFLPGALEPMSYQQKDASEPGQYALPENMDFKVMFYRTDIMEEIGAKVPDTWTELYNEVLPILDQNGMMFYMASDYAPFLFQLGGDYYNEDKTATALDSDVAYQAFLQWTRNYTVYDFETTADIYNHFRIGDIPLVIGGYNDYLKIMYAAPDLYGRWMIAPIPGTEQEDGTIDRTAGGASTTLMMFTDSKRKEDAWEFAKWWMSADVQYNFSTEVEATMGQEARWNSANVEAFFRLPWQNDHVPVFQEIFSQFENQPNALGGYYTARNVTNAWTRVVMNDMNPRKSWEQAIDDISNEMLRKQIEYGFTTEEEAYE